MIDLIKTIIAICTAIYIRVSTDKQVEKGYSISEQDCKLKALCIAQDLGEHEVYLDDGYTGKDMNRPELQRLLADVKSGKIKNIVIYKLDRLSRSLRDTLEIIEDILVPNGCRLISLTENLDTSTPVGRLIISILSAFAQLERETIKERMQMGMVGRAKTGKWKGGGKIPYAYNYDKEKGILVQNTNAIKVKQLYDLYINKGYGLQYIADLLGFPSGSFARQVLVRKASHGIVQYKGREYEGKHEPIIDKETYERAMAILKQRQELTYRTAKTTYYLLAGLLVCGKCGAKFAYIKQTNWTKLVCYSQGSQKHLIKDPDCDNSRLRMIDVENAVLDELFDIKCHFNSTSTSSNNENNILQLLRSQYEETARRIKRLYNLYAASDTDELLEIINENKKKLADLQLQIDSEIERKAITHQVNDTHQKIEDILSSWDYWDDKQKRDALRSCIEKIVVTDGNLEIYWRLTSAGSLLTSAHKAQVDNTLPHRQKQNIKFDNFWLDCMTENKAVKTMAGQVYDLYAEWCRTRGLHLETKVWFFDELRAKNLLAYSATVNGKTARNVIIDWELKAS